MVSICMYMLPEDEIILLKIIENFQDLAFIIPHSNNKWSASLNLGIRDRPNYYLWHMSAGPLWIKDESLDGNSICILNPQDGWESKRFIEGRETPWFDTGKTNILSINFLTESVWEGSVCGMSDISWLAGRYQIANSDTRNLWRRLRNHINKITVKVPRGGFDPTGKQIAEVYAFPAALNLIKDGNRADDNMGGLDYQRMPYALRSTKMKSIPPNRVNSHNPMA